MAAKKKTEVAETEIKVESTETIEAKPKKTTRKSTKKAEVKTEEPVAKEPITEEPKVEAPVEEAVEVIPEVKEEPAVTEEPKVEEPKVEEPKVEEKPVKAKKEPKAKKETAVASPKAVIAVTRIAAMSGPSFFSRQLGTYAEGTKFVITEEANGWGCVATNKWINLNYVKEA